MEGSFYDDLIFDHPYIKDRVARTYDGGKMEMIVETTDGCIYLYCLLYHTLTLISRGEPTDEDRKRIFGQKLSKMIWLNGMNQYDLAKELGVSNMTISNYVNGKSVPTFILVQRMMRILHCKENDLFFMG